MKRWSFLLIVFLLLAGANTQASAVESSYRIGPGDHLEISVWKDESLNRRVVVPPDRIISFPLIGDIDASNCTVTDLRKTIAKKLSEYIPDPVITVMLLEMNSMKAYVIGNVNRPGEFSITMETNVMQILSMAGGLNPFASTGEILILRQQDNRTVKIPFNYDQVESGESLEQNIFLKRGDVVLVP